MTVTKIERSDVYKSPDLQVTKFAIEGHVMKAIANINFFTMKSITSATLKFDLILSTAACMKIKKSLIPRVYIGRQIYLAANL